MRINKGSKVEVQTQDATATAPVGGWRGGEVIWGNGHSYTMRWFDGGPESVRIPRKCVRPCPPPFALPPDLAVGDMVEVRDGDCLWKCAEVVRAGAGEFDVKIVGSTRVVTAAVDALRVRQVLREDNVWVALHKGNEIPRPMEAPSRRKDGGNGNGGGGGRFAALAKGWKAKRGNMMSIGNLSGNAKKLCVKEEPLSPARSYGDNLEVVYVNSTTTTTLAKQQNVVGAGGDNGGGAMSASSSSSSSGGSSSGSSDSSSSCSSDSSSSSDRSSASSSSSDDGGGGGGCGGAASATNAPRQDRLAAGDCAANAPRHDGRDAIQPQQSCKEEVEERPGGGAGACSLVGGVGRHHDQSREVVGDEGERRRLQMHGYISLMTSFHAAGSLSWEKEALLTDMRLHLNISCDEHLQVIRELNARGKPGTSTCGS